MRTMAIIQTSVDPQLESSFFVPPVEIRDAIYVYLVPERRIHLFLRNQRLQLSGCDQPDKDDTPYHPKYPQFDPRTCQNSDDHVYWRRLQSPWGPHWRCEESVNDGAAESYLFATDVLLTCKRMFAEFAGYMASKIALHINDLDALKVFLPIPRSGSLPESESAFDLQSCIPTYSFTLLDHLLPNLTVLEITMKLPVSVYTAIEHASTCKITPPSSNPASSSTPTSAASTDPESLISAWTNFPRSLPHLSKLRQLKIWLDHDETCSWTQVVNERALLSPLEGFVRGGGLEKHALDIDISVDLPKLHPKWWSDDRHFADMGVGAGAKLEADIVVNTGPSPPSTGRHTVSMTRRYRQWWHGVLLDDGTAAFTEQYDFPEFVERGEYLAACGDYPEISREQEEVDERNALKTGYDILADWKDFLDYLDRSVCSMGTL
ncbi:hypothetical protein BCR34DRAFT_212293 [Clohesyomyces aquaticus]|uniref:DUF7730 domain-containing protein n=1 Tax=Clohesyomyces aquaticus TaxID=1231657 RepID=A0A1Y1ZYD1_9PLEO|nr:hypothetical protein BCR34DRAFT_212293 [Clohesyomyces aquaticus]